MNQGRMDSVGREGNMTRNLSLCFFLCASWVAAQPIVLKTSTMLDGQGHVLKNQSIVIEDGKILRDMTLQEVRDIAVKYDTFNEYA